MIPTATASPSLPQPDRRGCWARADCTPHPELVGSAPRLITTVPSIAISFVSITTQASHTPPPPAFCREHAPPLMFFLNQKLYGFMEYNTLNLYILMP